MAWQRENDCGRRWAVALWLAVVALTPAWLPAAPGAAPPVATAPGAGEQIEALVRNLGDNDYQTREQAEKHLRAIGAPALDALTAALSSNDAEVRQRATRLTAAIRRNQTRSDALWQVTLPAAPMSPPAAGQGRVYLCTRDGWLRAFDGRTGKQQWCALVGGYVWSAPIPAGDAVAVASGDGRVLCFDAAGGTLRWLFREPGGLAGTGAAGGRVWVSSASGLYALDAKTGKVQWRAALEGIPIGAPAPAPGLASRAGAAPGAGEVYVALADGKLAAYGAGDGKLRWQAEVGRSLTGGPAAAGAMLYLGTDEGLLAVDPATHKMKWECVIPDYGARAMNGPAAPWAAAPGGPGAGAGAAPLVAGDRVLARAGDKLWAFDAATGAPGWSFLPLAPDRARGAQAGGGPGVGPGAGPGAVLPPGVIRVRGGGRLIIQGNVQIAGMGANGPGAVPVAAVAGGLALMATGEGLFAGDARTGLQMWSFPTPSPAAGPAVDGGMIYFTYGGGRGLVRVLPNGQLTSDETEAHLVGLAVK